MALQGGTARTICAADNPFGMSWEGDALLLGQGRRGIWRVAADGGTPELLFRVNDGEEAYGPRLLPDGAVLYTIATGVEWLRWDQARIVVHVPGASTPTTVYKGGADARYLPSTGHLVFARGGTLLAAGFDVRRRRLTAAPVPVIEGVRRGNNRDTGVAHFSISDTGRLIYVPGPFIGPEWGDQEIVIADRSGAVERVALPPGGYRGVRASPTGRHITFASDSGPRGIVYTCDLSGPMTMRPLEGPGSNRYPIFAATATGLRVVFQSDRDGDEALYWQSADGTGLAERLTRPRSGRVARARKLVGRHAAVQRDQGLRRVAVDDVPARPHAGAFRRRPLGVPNGSTILAGRAVGCLRRRRGNDRRRHRALCPAISRDRCEAPTPRQRVEGHPQ